jgi:hypothetical protein
MYADVPESLRRGQQLSGVRLGELEKVRDVAQQELHRRT